MDIFVEKTESKGYGGGISEYMKVWLLSGHKKFHRMKIQNFTE